VLFASKHFFFHIVQVFGRHTDTLLESFFVYSIDFYENDQVILPTADRSEMSGSRGGRLLR
jgi:hypothetical protein